MFSLILYRKSRSKRSGDVSWSRQSMYRFSISIVSLTLNLFFEPFDFLSQTHNFKEEKHIAMPEELAYFLRDGSFTDFVSDLARYFLRKKFFRIHLNQNQINLRDDNRYENRIIIQNLCVNQTVTLGHPDIVSSCRLNSLCINACRDYEGN